MPPRRTAVNTETRNTLQSYINQPTGFLRFGKIRVGRVEFRDIYLVGCAAANQLLELIQSICDKTRRVRVRNDGTRYPEPLPIAAPARKLSVEIADYLGDMRRRNLQPRTIEKAARTLHILLMACGDIQVSRILHKEIYLLWDLLIWSPPNLTSDPNLVGLPVEDLISRGKAANVAAPAVATLELHRRFLTSFFNQLTKARAIPFSPMDAFSEVKKDLIEEPGKVERLFDDADVQRIFHLDTFLPWASESPHRWWAPILGLYTGARINEICQLKVDDIVMESGRWCMAIRKTSQTQSLKGKSAVRKIPIPQPVLDAGLLDFVDDIKAFGHPRLFPHLSAGVNQKSGKSNARYSQGFLIQFGRYLNDLGFPKGVRFHAFRHTLATELDNEGVREEDIALLTGHSLSKKVPTLQRHYIHKKPEAIRKRQVNALTIYQPAVELPRYIRGQFSKKLRAGVKTYP